MPNVTQKKANKKNISLWEKIGDWAFDKLILSLLITLFSTALVAGSAYLLWGAQSEADQLESTAQYFSRESEELQTSMRMMETRSGGWFALARGNLATKAEIVRRLSTEIRSESLDEGFVSRGLQFCASSLIELAQEKGRLESFLFNESLHKENQRSILNQYTAQLKSINALQTMLLGWRGSSPQTRDAWLATLTDAGLDFLQGNAAELNTYEQMLIQSKRKSSENTSKYNVAMNELKKIRWKTALSVLGIAFGSSVIMLAAGLTLHRIVVHGKRAF
jgi:hypothetical protein